MRVSFHGAAREVTGSCYLVETDQTRVMIDCGMFQGSVFADAKNYRDVGFDPSTVDAGLITHAHLDHIGRLPKIANNGFKGPLFATGPTTELANIVLDDAEQVMTEDARREIRPKLYEKADVEKIERMWKVVEYGKTINIGNLQCSFADAGHILGSSFVTIKEKGGPTIMFSGDLGNVPDPILRPTARFPACDALVIESTYGNRMHEQSELRSTELQKCIIDTIKKGGVLIIPSFAIERTQELLFELDNLLENKHLPKIEVYLDSPLAIRASKIMKSYPQYYNADALKVLTHDHDLFDFPGLHQCLSRDDSKAINEAHWPKVIIAGSGMMTGGRILHHLVRYLGNPKSTVLIIGYQAHGTLGRKLYTGERVVNVLGERINVKAHIQSIGAYSAHADQRQLMNNIRGAISAPKVVYCTHGEEDAAAALSTRIKEDLNIPTHVPRFEEVITL